MMAPTTIKNRLIFLLIKRKEEYVLLPDDDFLVKRGDEMLIVCNEESEVDLAYILNNYYELFYVLNGKEKVSGLLGYFHD